MSGHKSGHPTGRIASQILGAEFRRKPFGGGTVYFPKGDRPANSAGLPVPRFGAGRIVVQRPHALPFDQAVAGGDGDTPDFAGVQDGIAFANEQASTAEYDAERALGQTAPGAPASGLAQRHLEALGKRRDAALAEAPDGFAAERTRALFDGVLQRQGARAIGAEHQARQSERIQGTETALGRLRERALGDPGNLEAHIDEGRALLGRMVETGLSGAGAAGRAQSFEDDLRRGVLDSLAKDDPRRALESLEGGAFDNLFEDEGGKARIRDGLELWSGKQELREDERRQAEQDAGRRRFADTLAQGFHDGSADDVHIDLALAAGAIDEAGAEDLRGRLSGIEAHNGELDGIGRFILGGDEDPGFTIDGDKNPGFGQDSNDAGIFVDPEMIDGWWQREMERRNRFSGLTTLKDNQSPEVLQEIPAELLIQTVERTGHVPTPVTNGLRATILAGGAAEKVAAGKQLAGLQRDAPEVAGALINRLPPEEAQQINIIAGIAELPLPPERIDGIARERIEKLPEVTNMPFVIGEDEFAPDPHPAMNFPGMVWENGVWRPETAAEREARVKSMKPVLMNAAVKASDAAVANDDAGIGDEIDGLSGGTSEAEPNAPATPGAPDAPDAPDAPVAPVAPKDGDPGIGDEIEGLGGVKGGKSDDAPDNHDAANRALADPENRDRLRENALAALEQEAGRTNMPSSEFLRRQQQICDAIPGDMSNGIDVAAIPLALPFLLSGVGASGSSSALAGILTILGLGALLKGDAGLRARNGDKNGKPPSSKRTDIGVPPPPVPPREPDKRRPSNKEEFPAKPPIKEIDLSRPIPENQEPGIYIHNMPPDILSKIGKILESKGNPLTKAELDVIRDLYLDEIPGAKHIGGGRERYSGIEKTELHIPGPGKDLGDGRPGGRFADLTFKLPNGKIIHIQTVDVDKNGKIADHEQKAGLDIFRYTKNTDVIMIPKIWQLAQYPT